MNTNNFIGIKLKLLSKKEILEKISLFIGHPTGFFHIVSINPENVVVSIENELFRNVLSEGDIQLIDGVGIALGMRFLSVPKVKRLAGVDFMEELLKTYSTRRLRVLFLGGRPDLANKLSNCYNKKYPNLSSKGIFGIQNISNPSKLEEERIFSIVTDYKPQIIFAAFGSPLQELWFYRHNNKLNGIICMGVGGGFDYAYGIVARAPSWLRNIGLEWLFRLISQPWRFKRQLRLLTFVYLVLKEKFSQNGE